MIISFPYKMVFYKMLYKELYISRNKAEDNDDDGGVLVYK